MSNLLVQNDDFPAAAEKMLADAKVLHKGGRYDGACYLVGYAVECSFKTVLLIEAFARRVGARTTPSLVLELANSNQGMHAQAMNKLRQDVRHHLSKALEMTHGRGNVPLPLYACGVTRRYVRSAWFKLAVLRWKETSRYAAPGKVSAKTSRRWIKGAKAVVDATIVAMRQDRVVIG